VRLLCFTLLYLSRHRLLLDMGGLYFSYLLSICFLFLSFSVRICFSFGHSDQQSFTSAEHCNRPEGESPWWLPLQSIDKKGRDPCEIHEEMKQAGIVTTCCAGNSLNTVQGGSSGCGPCSLDMYNLAVACMACSDDEFSRGIPEISNATRYIHDERGDGQSRVDVPFPKLSDFNKGTKNVPLVNFDLPPWLSVNTTKDDYFDPTAAVNAAELASFTASISSATPTTSSTNGYTPPIPTSSPDSPRDSDPASSTSTPGALSNAKTPSRAVTIAAATVGTFVGVALLTLAAILFLRKRRRARIPPSARFITVAGPAAGGMGYTMSGDEEAMPPPFSPGDWKMPIIEKVESTADVQRQYDAGLYRGSSY